MYHGKEGGPTRSDRFRFCSVRAGPARTLHSLLQGLRRGAEIVTLSLGMRCERQAVLSQVESLAGRYISRSVSLRISDIGGDFPVHLERAGLSCGPGLGVSPFATWQTQRTLLIVDHAELLDDRNCRLPTDISDIGLGNSAQVIIAGGNDLLPRLCSPNSAMSGDCPGFRQLSRIRLPPLSAKSPQCATRWSEPGPASKRSAAYSQYLQATRALRPIGVSTPSANPP